MKRVFNTSLFVCYLVVGCLAPLGTGSARSFDREVVRSAQQKQTRAWNADHLWARKKHIVYSERESRPDPDGEPLGKIPTALMKTEAALGPVVIACHPQTYTLSHPLRAPPGA